MSDEAHWVEGTLVRQESGQCDSHRLGCGRSYWALVGHGGLGQPPCPTSGGCLAAFRLGWEKSLQGVRARRWKSECAARLRPRQLAG